jgi:RNA polymerase sigma-70 factor, ECF subfamily
VCSRCAAGELDDGLADAPPFLAIRGRRRRSGIRSPRVPLGDGFDSALAGAKAGAEGASAALYRDVHPSLLRFLRAQEWGDAEDIAAETWLDAARGLPRFSGDEPAFKRWIFTIARRRLVDFRRRQGRSVREVALGHLAERAGPVDVEGTVLAGSETDAALARIADLPPAQAEVVLLRVVAGLDVADVARMTGRTSGAVRVLQHRALHRLAEELAAERRLAAR